MTQQRDKPEEGPHTPRLTETEEGKIFRDPPTETRAQTKGTEGRWSPPEDQPLPITFLLRLLQRLATNDNRDHGVWIAAGAKPAIQALTAEAKKALESLEQSHDPPVTQLPTQPDPPQQELQITAYMGISVEEVPFQPETFLYLYAGPELAGYVQTERPAIQATYIPRSAWMPAPAQ